jgi:hypothetical protein
MIRKAVFLFFSLCLTNGAFTQSESGLELILGVNNSNFQFTNSLGELQSEYMSQSSQLIGVQANRSSKRSSLRFGATFREGGAIYNEPNLSVSWKINYLGVSAGYLFAVINKPKIKIYPGLSYYLGYMLNGQQLVNQEIISLNDGKLIKKIDHGVEPLLGVKYRLFDNISLSIEYRLGLGLAQLENNPMNQKTYNRFSSFVVGLGITLNTKKSEE